MIDAIGLFIGVILRVFRTRRTLLLENLALRQQLVALKRRHPRPKVALFDKVIWVMAQRFWCGGTQRYEGIARPEEDALTRAMIALASEYGRYGYRRITVRFREAGWQVGTD